MSMILNLKLHQIKHFKLSGFQIKQFKMRKRKNHLRFTVWNFLSYLIRFRRPSLKVNFLALKM